MQLNPVAAKLVGTDPNRDYVSLPSASVVRSDFHWLPVLDSCIRLHPENTGQSNFNLKFLASKGITVSIHGRFLTKACETNSGGNKLDPQALSLLGRRKERHLTWDKMPFIVPYIIFL